MVLPGCRCSRRGQPGPSSSSIHPPPPTPSLHILPPCLPSPPPHPTAAKKQNMSNQRHQKLSFISSFQNSTWRLVSFGSTGSGLPAWHKDTSTGGKQWTQRWSIWTWCCTPQQLEGEGEQGSTYWNWWDMGRVWGGLNRSVINCALHFLERVVGFPRWFRRKLVAASWRSGWLSQLRRKSNRLSSDGI